MVMAPLSLEVLLVLVVVSVFAGIGCTTTGAGGIFVTIALFAFTPLSSAEVAGTAHVVFAAVGVIGAIGFARSGELLESDGRLLAAVLSASSVLGALAGAGLNAYVSRRLFSAVLGILAGTTGLVLCYGQRRDLPSVAAVDATASGGRLVFGIVGLALGLASGLAGIGGPILAVPALVTLGVPLLLAVGVAQVQAIFISGFAAGGYHLQGAISPFFASLTGIPTVVGAVAGWLIAHRVDPDRLELLLGVLLVPVGAYLIA